MNNKELLNNYDDTITFLEKLKEDVPKILCKPKEKVVEKINYKLTKKKYGVNKIKKGDEVITSPYTFISTINTLYQLELKIVFVDISMDDFNINYDEIKQKITKKTKAIIVVHIYGLPVDMKRVIKIAPTTREIPDKSGIIRR